MRLNFKSLGEGPPLIILHGIFGSLDNWFSLGRSLSEFREVFLIDQRNHGLSPHSEEFNYEAMAEDLANFIETHHIKNPAVMGHSMGGKTAMKFAVRHTDMWDKLIVVDIAPKYYPVHHQKIIEALQSLDLSRIDSRKEADEKLAKKISEDGERQFLLKNLQRVSSGGYQWKMNLETIAREIGHVGEGLEDRLATEKPVLFLRGENSHYIEDSDIILINHIFPNARLETIPGAGHWIHADQPQLIFDAVRDFLRE